MKKYYASLVALLAIAAGCQKEIEENEISGTRVPVSISVVQDEEDTKSLFVDNPGTGKQFITWEKGDEIDVLLRASSDEDAQTIQGWRKSSFSMSDVDNAVFNGWFYFTTHKVTEMLYAIYPSNASRAWDDDPKSVYVNLPDSQHPTQQGFDGQADVMVSQPYALGAELAKTYPVTEGEMYVNSSVNLQLKFAHLFGFGRLAFDCTQHAEELVKQVEIKAPKICGDFTVDVTAGFANLNVTSTAGSGDGGKLTIVSDGTLALKDYVCWFVGAPGTYEDVHILVYTDKSILAYDRQGLQLVRSCITRKTIHSTTNDDISKRKLLRSFKIKTGVNSWVNDYGLEYDASNRVVYERYGTKYTATLNGNGKIASSVYESPGYKIQTAFTYAGEQLTSRSYQAWSDGTLSQSWTKNYSWSGSNLQQVERQVGSSVEIRQTVTESTTPDAFNVTNLLLADMDVWDNTPDPLDLLVSATNSFHTQALPSQVVKNNLEAEIVTVDKYVATTDADGLITTLKCYRNNQCKASITFSYSMEVAPDPEFPEDPAFPGTEAKLPRHLIRTDAAGNRDVTDLTYDSQNRLTSLSRSGGSGPLTATFTWGTTSATAEVNDNGSKSTYTYVLEDGKVVSVTGPHTLVKGKTMWGDSYVEFDGNGLTPYGGNFLDSKGGIGIAYVLSECPDYGPALLPIFQSADLGTHYSNGMVPVYYDGNSGGTETNLAWLLTDDADGDLSEVLTVKDGKTIAAMSISYTDDYPAEPFMLPASPAVPGKKICQVEASMSGYPETGVFYYDASGNPWIIKEDRSITVLITSGTRTTGKNYNTSLSRDNKPKFVLDRNASGKPVKLISGNTAARFTYSGETLTSITAGNESYTFEWADGNITRITGAGGGISSTIEFTYGTVKDNVGMCVNGMMGSFVLPLLLDIHTKNAPVKAVEVEDGNPTFQYDYEYETDTAGDITQYRQYISRAGMSRLQQQVRYFYNYNPIPPAGGIVNGGGSGEDYDVKPL